MPPLGVDSDSNHQQTDTAHQRRCPVNDIHDSEPRPHPEPLSFDAPWRYELHFPCDPRGPGVARATLQAILTAHGIGELVDRAALLTTELTTNSVRHSRGPALVRLMWLCPVLRVSVWDRGPGLPPVGCPAVAEPYADSGRGLVILDALADRWGGCGAGEGPYGPDGKTVWFELAVGRGGSLEKVLAA